MTKAINYAVIMNARTRVITIEATLLINLPIFFQHFTASIPMSLVIEMIIVILFSTEPTPLKCTVGACNMVTSSVFLRKNSTFWTFLYVIFFRPFL